MKKRTVLGVVLAVSMGGGMASADDFRALGQANGVVEMTTSELKAIEGTHLFGHTCIACANISVLRQGNFSVSGFGFANLQSNSASVRQSIN